MVERGHRCSEMLKKGSIMQLVLRFVNKPSKILIKILNPVEYSESDIQTIKAPRNNNLMI